ncbi:MAG: phospho-N-acetylmuramoyl-pentapeptide-transferase [Candidatus Rokuibacteriota bacterium]|nr:MAG: phospho-N-acetylmuramoyl-pentapeptide-transferase [Candidatus Rokubacteria bacterium]
MVGPLIAGIVALVIAVVSGPRFIAFLRRREYGQHVNPDVPQQHGKQGTPTMGGLLLLVAATIPVLALSKYTSIGITVFLCALGCGAIGLLDDVIKLRRERSLGLRGRYKLLLLALVSAGVGYVTYHRDFQTSVYLPVVNGKLPLSWGWYLLVFLMIAGAANAVNLTDGLDGLAAGTGAIAVGTFTAMAVIAWIRSGAPGHRNDIYLDLAIVGTALIGAIVGFLWYNAWPAEVFMGDTGSMAIGGALAAFAIVMKVEILLLLVGGIFVIEALSVIIQVISFRYFGRRVFLMTPIHHHFEMKAWSETKIMVRFWIAGAILCALAFALYYRYYFKFFRS